MIRLAVRYPTLTIIATLLVAFWGLNYFFTMSQREDPDIKFNACQLITYFPGALPEDIEQYVTKPLEDVASEISEVDEIRSESRYSVSVITVWLDTDIPDDEIDQIWDRLRTKIDRIRSTLPDGCLDPVVDDEFFDNSSHIIALYGENYSYRELAAFAERIKDILTPLPDAGRVTVVADQPERIYLEYDQARLTKYGLNFENLVSTIQGSNVLMPGGMVDITGDKYFIDSTGDFQTLKDLENLPVYGTLGGHQVRLGDLGEVRYAYEEPPTYLARANGHPCVLVSVVMKKGKNVVALGREVEEALDQIRQSMPADLEMDVMHDQPFHVSVKVHTFLKNLFSGIGLVIVVVFLFMGLRLSIPVGLAIPLVIVSTFAVMSLLGTTLQQMSIAGLIISLGMLVDNAIVVTDNISRFMEEGFSRKQAAVKATEELAIPMLTSSLTTVCAFFPLAMIEGDAGKFIRDIPVVVSIAIMVSYLIAITVTPTICSFIVESRRKRSIFQPLDPLMRLMERIYPPMLAWSQRHGILTGLIVAVAFIGSLMLFPKLGVQFFPKASRNQFAIDIFLPDGSSIDNTLEKTIMVEEILDDHDGIQSYLSHVGQGGPQYYYNRVTSTPNPRYAEILVNTLSPAVSAELVPVIRAQVAAAVPGARVEVKGLEQGPPVGAPIQVMITGENLDVMKGLGGRVKEIMRRTPNVIDVQDSFGNDSKQLKLVVDETLMRAIGNTKADINKMTLLLTNGYTVTEYRAPSRSIPVVIRAQGSQRASAACVDNLYTFNTYTGTNVPLSSIAHLETRLVTSKIQREDRVRRLTVSCYTDGSRLASQVLAEMQPEIQQLELPSGYKLKFSGEAEESGEAFSGLGSAAVVAVFLIILVLVAQFKSLRISLVVFLSIPLALIGAVLGLYVTGWPFGFTAGLGVVSLAGIVINNAIILMDFIIIGLKQGMPLQEAINNAGQARLRPILLTTATTIGGLLPLGLFGGSMWAPMAFAIIGGLIVSTFLTLIVVPLIFRAVAGKVALRLAQGDLDEEAEAAAPAGEG